MPKTRPPQAADAPKRPVEAVRDVADALYRAATECCHQHERVSLILARSSMEEEVAAAQRLCELCSETLRSFVQAYERVSADVHPGGADEGWWRRANALWLSSREYLRRHQGCDASTRELKRHGPDRLEALHADYELEASSLLALRQAAEAYRQDRPAAA